MTSKKGDSSKKKSNWEKYGEIIPLSLSIILFLASLIKIQVSDYGFNQIHYIGLGCLILSLFFFFSNKKIYIFIFGATLTLGLFGFLDFFYMTYKIGFADFGINPLFVILMILFFVFGKDSMNKIFPDKAE